MNVSDPSGAEVHIAGLVVHALPEAADRVKRRLERVPGARVHAASADGKLVVTIESTTADAIAAELVRLQTLDDVLAASLVYQHCEPAAAMEDEVDLEDHA